MKTNGTNQRWIGALAGLLILALGGCTDPFLPKEKDPAGTAIPPGMGLARISLSLGGERTVMPPITSYFFTLDFSAPSKTPVHIELSNVGAGSIDVPLEPATWTLTVNGYSDSGHTNLMLTGYKDITITADTDESFDVYLTPNLGSGGLGSLEYDIDLSALPAGTVRAWLGLYPLEAPGTIAHQSLSHEIDLSLSAGSSAADTISDLPQGTYRAVVDLYDSGANKAAVRTEVVHIYNGPSTLLTYSFDTEDFADCPTKIDGATLAAELDDALTSTPGSYTIILDDETDLAAFAPKPLNVTGGKNIHITIRGNGKTVQVDRIGTPLFILGADTGSSLTLELRDITLTGLSDNYSSMVQVNDRGTLSMKAGSRITGNTSSSSGGGVYVNGGTFNLSGGSVSGNATSIVSSGGGVYVVTGTFDMSGGAVSGNTASYDGGGVYVSNNAAFNLSGGAVSGNTSSSSGGGVYVSNDGAAFNMSGGAVSGNTTFSFSFHYGGGVVSGGIFNMSGGAVRNNTLSDANSYGREVLVYGGTFKLSGDAMPQRVFLYDSTGCITISGPLSGGTIPIDLGITSSAPLTDYKNIQILRKDSAYNSGNLAELKNHFSLGEAKRTDTSDAGTPIDGYKIDDDGYVVEAP
jgi:hypothetical protein